MRVQPTTSLWFGDYKRPHALLYPDSGNMITHNRGRHRFYCRQSSVVKDGPGLAGTSSGYWLSNIPCQMEARDKKCLKSLTPGCGWLPTF
ncbi:hypothetical protein CEXT_513591 [Caerostris extrusa]|uniref:Uncharacterized protein n=1 Tax=Caerostris extrusa TaxID=172846 RepID=A0AAV4YA11_CAEEX|nr:hypothetical protein CEXT_513591 [Caerostris extrusa]